MIDRIDACAQEQFGHGTRLRVAGCRSTDMSAKCACAEAATSSSEPPSSYAEASRHRCIRDLGLKRSVLAEADQVSSGYRRAGYILDDEEDSVGPELHLLGAVM